MTGYVLDGGGPKDSENTLNSFLTKRDGNALWQIGTDMAYYIGLSVSSLILPKGKYFCNSS